MGETLIKAENLTKKYGGFTAVDNISFEVKRGEIFAFLGPNGAGKTTTIKLLTGLLKPTAGKCFVAGVDIQADPVKAKQKMGLIPDQPFIYPYLTGFEFMRFVGDIYKVSVDLQKQRIPGLLEMFELHDRQDEMVESYSHGMKQKLVFAAMLLHEPEVIFLDEPLVGLDPKSARLVKKVFTKLAEKGKTIFLCTHVLEIAEKLADRAGIILNGKIIALESMQELKKKAVPGSTFEDVFLDLTGGTQYVDVTENLK